MATKLTSHVRPSNELGDQADFDIADGRQALERGLDAVRGRGSITSRASGARTPCGAGCPTSLAPTVATACTSHAMPFTSSLTA